MLDPKKCHQVIDDLAKKLASALSDGVKNVKNDMEKTFHSILQTAFSKLDLVTREEFDVQAAVLAKTRSKLDALERVVTELEIKADLRKVSDPSNQREND